MSILLLLIFLPCHVAFRILVFQLGMELIPPAVEAQSPNHSWKQISLQDEENNSTNLRAFL